ncbi:alpha carbonic anhydrase 7 [Silene latifolia]|uniref:alpha carbonic anhydrase 7 n=1 Tax=Silene latifolia TaxID=37657 RepID=UPI003D78547B
MQIKPVAMLWISFFLILSIATFITCQEVEDETEFNYIEGDKRGPENWGYIKKEWAVCKTGKLQSPIDLPHKRVTLVPKSEEIIKFYRTSHTLLKNRGHDIQIEWVNKNSKIKINGTNYILTQSHWHSPSEHTINGIRFDLELHMVHQSKDNKIAVIGLLYKIGRPDPFLSKLIKKIKSIGVGEEIEGGLINPAEIKMGGRKYYRYMGSLTTPPCTEGVLWTVNEQIGTVSKKQVKSLRDAVHDDAQTNARPLQPRNGRKVNLYYQPIKKYTYEL